MITDEDTLVLFLSPLPWTTCASDDSVAETALPRYDPWDEVECEIDNALLSERLTEAMLALTLQELIVIMARYIVPNEGLRVKQIRYQKRYERTLSECGKYLGVTAARVRQIENKALRRLRHPKRKLESMQ